VRSAAELLAEGVLDAGSRVVDLDLVAVLGFKEQDAALSAFALITVL
jgi:hypothetical protein